MNKTHLYSSLCCRTFENALPWYMCIFCIRYYSGNQKDGRCHKGTWQSYGINGLRKGFVFAFHGHFYTYMLRLITGKLNCILSLVCCCGHCVIHNFSCLVGWMMLCLICVYCLTCACMMEVWYCMQKCWMRCISSIYEIFTVNMLELLRFQRLWRNLKSSLRILMFEPRFAPPIFIFCQYK